MYEPVTSDRARNLMPSCYPKEAVFGAKEQLVMVVESPPIWPCFAAPIPRRRAIGRGDAHFMQIFTK